MLGITMNFDISAMLTSKRTFIICHHMKFIKQKEKRRNKKCGGPNQTHVEQMKQLPKKNCQINLYKSEHRKKSPIMNKI